jgi:hypothetical protein
MPMPYLRDVRLTLGLMGLDELHLRVLATSSDDETERKSAARGTYQNPGALWLGLLMQPIPSFETTQQGPSLGTCGEKSTFFSVFLFY